ALDEVFSAHGEQFRLRALRLLPPPLEAAGRDDVGGDAGVVEVVDGLVVAHEIAAAGALFELLALAAQLPVGAVEGLGRVPLAVDEGVAYEQLARVLAVEAGELHAAAVDDGHAEEGDPFVGDDGALLLLPVRL